ncbi:2-keto-4-pentenoate hydratase [Pseudomonas sp. LRF_L74]|uniref:2-keto-4-pentenoate hydratase n=1 Tax=Pseudomonas sp. LRF_L74 TaxID=3369422 RepID=UPI003F63BC2F
MTALADLPQRLLRAQACCEPLPAIDADSLDLTAGYFMQRNALQLREARQERLTGWKIAFASEAAQRRFGLVEPVYGALTDSMSLQAGQDVDLFRLIQPKLEIELALILGRERVDSACSDADILSSVASVALAFEIADCRWQGWRFGAGAFLADNAAAALYCLSAAQPFDAQRHAQVEFHLTRDGEEIGSGLSSLTQEAPLSMLCWLVRRLLADGQCLRAGQVILSGALLPPMEILPGRYSLKMLGMELALAFCRKAD